MNPQIQQLLENGLSVIPITPGAKYPCIKWDEYKNKIATPEEADGWNMPIGIVGGKVSGGLIAIDFDDKGSRFNAWMDLIQGANQDLALKIVVQQTPSGGFHVLYRCPSVGMGNEKLATMEDRKVLIETRGEGGQFLACPSDGYVLIQNDFLTLPVLSEKEHALLIDCARSFNEKTKEEHIEKPTSGLTVYDDYDSKVDAVDLLISYGWTKVFEKDGVVFLRRPGKDDGISATWNKIPGRLYVFTSSTVFEPEHIYKPSSMYAHLEHNGDFKAAARALASMGYGNKELKEKTELKTEEVLVVRAKDFIGKIKTLRNVGMPKGYSTGFAELDKFYTIAKGQLNIVTGAPHAGKSEFMDAMMISMAMNDKLKFCVYSPENYPLELHFQKLAEKYIGQYFFRLTEEELNIAIQFIHDHFYFIPAVEAGLNLNRILELAEKTHIESKIDGLLIDPWNEVEIDRGENITETEYIGQSLSKARKFARRLNIATFIVAHPTKLKKEKTAAGWEYPIPTLWDISGSANWKNKADNGIIVWRDFINNCTKIIVEKIRFKYYGRSGEVTLYYDRNNGRYSETAKDIVF